MFKHILVTTDGSELSQAALPYAAGLARALHSQLTLLYVVPEPDLYLAQAEGLLYDPVSQRRELREGGQRALDEAAALLGMPAQQLLPDARHHDVATTIANTATEQDADVIVMASHGRSGLSHLLMGSVAERVMHRAKVPVLLVRDAAVPKRKAELSGG